MPVFLHASDLHLAKPFGRFEDLLRGRLREARHRKIAALAAAARANGISLVLLAGDTFDAETPPSQVVRQALRAFGAEQDITWILLPGNHDSLAAEELWSRVAREAPDNLRLALVNEPIEIGTDLVILPAPPPVRHPGRDLTEWMETAETGDRVRVGLAHGSVQGFGESDPSLGVVPPDRAERSGLDYLALGDWHGCLRIGPRCWYSGAPEPDSFKGHDPACALAVRIAAPGALPEVTPIPLGEIDWREIRLDLRPGEDPGPRLEAALPAPAARRDTLVSLVVEGRLGLAERAALLAAIADIREDFGHLDEDLSALEVEQAPEDLDRIATGGALRDAADRLAARVNAAGEAGDPVAQAALNRLYAFAQEEGDEA